MGTSYIFSILKIVFDIHETCVSPCGLGTSKEIWKKHLNGRSVRSVCAQHDDELHNRGVGSLATAMRWQPEDAKLLSGLMSTPPSDVCELGVQLGGIPLYATKYIVTRPMEWIAVGGAMAAKSIADRMNKKRAYDEGPVGVNEVYNGEPAVVFPNPRPISVPSLPSNKRHKSSEPGGFKAVGFPSRNSVRVSRGAYEGGVMRHRMRRLRGKKRYVRRKRFRRRRRYVRRRRY